MADLELLRLMDGTGAQFQGWSLWGLVAKWHDCMAICKNQKKDHLGQAIIF